MINQDGIDAGRQPAGDPQTPVAHASRRDQEQRSGVQRAAWRRASISRFGFELTLSDAGSGIGNGAGPSGPSGPGVVSG